MALDINGYNTDFNAFVKFAQNSFVTNDDGFRAVGLLTIVAKHAKIMAL